MNELLEEYKLLVDFDDKMQKSNMKFVQIYLSYRSRKKQEGWEKDCTDFLVGAIESQKDLIKNINNYKMRYGGSK